MVLSDVLNKAVKKKSSQKRYNRYINSGRGDFLNLAKNMHFIFTSGPHFGPLQEPLE